MGPRRESGTSLAQAKFAAHIFHIAVDLHPEGSSYDVIPGVDLDRIYYRSPCGIRWRIQFRSLNPFKSRWDLLDSEDSQPDWPPDIALDLAAEASMCGDDGLGRTRRHRRSSIVGLAVVTAGAVATRPRHAPPPRDPAAGPVSSIPACRWFAIAARAAAWRRA